MLPQVMCGDGLTLQAAARHQLDCHWASTGWLAFIVAGPPVNIQQQQQQQAVSDFPRALTVRQQK